MKLKIENGGKCQAEAVGEERVHLVYQPKYKKGDAIVFENDEAGFYRIRFEDTLEPAIVFIEKGTSRYEIPFGVMRAGYSPRAFIGKRHFIEVTKCHDEAMEVRNIAFNPFDINNLEPCENGIYPHAYTNVRYPDSFRNTIIPDKGLFSARNVLDGISASESHRLYPHHSWGISRDDTGELTIEFGRPVDIKSVCLTLRSELPHDSWWETGSLVFHHCDLDTCEQEDITFEGTKEEQIFDFEKTKVDFIRLTNLKGSGTGFKALSNLRVIGKYEEV